VPDGFEALSVGLEEMACREAAEVQGWGMGALDAVDVGVDDHFVVETEDRVVERGPVEPDLDALDVAQRPVGRQGVADTGRQGAFAEVFFFAAQGYFWAVGVAEQQSDAATAGGFLSEAAREEAVQLQCQAAVIEAMAALYDELGLQAQQWNEFATRLRRT
jgi:hypothetical protein